jgi:hypothetical protein
MDDPIGIAQDQIGVMGRENDSGSPVMEMGEDLHHLTRHRVIQVSCRFVRQKERGIIHQGPGDGHPLLFSS